MTTYHKTRATDPRCPNCQQPLKRGRSFGPDVWGCDAPGCRETFWMPNAGTTSDE